MAERRMFSKTIIDSDAFLEMPHSTQLLYFHLSMRADDDGFINNPKNIMRMTGCKDDDMSVLITKKFIIPFDSGVVVIKHWKIHNYIAKDRYKETKYKEEKSRLSLDENNSYTTCIQPVYKMDTQVRLGKDSIGKDSIGKCYEENIGMITPAVAEILYSFLDNMEEDMVCEAIKIATINNKRSMNYIRGILNSWNNKGYKVLADIQNENKIQNNAIKEETKEEKIARWKKEWGEEDED